MIKDNDKDINVPCKTNADRIRSMTDEELANWLTIISSSIPISSPEWLEWLRKETET